jgi:hypothetical protein
MAVGTPLYMAPEQALGGELGPWTDLYAVGCIAYELLTGTVPFSGTTLVELLSQHAKTIPAALTDFAPGVPSRLNALVLELLEKSPAKRPRSAALVRRDLERIERGLSVASTRVTGLRVLAAADRDTLMTSFRRRPGRGRGWIAVGTALALGAVVATIAAVVSRSSGSVVTSPPPTARAAPQPAVPPPVRVEAPASVSTPVEPATAAPPVAPVVRAPKSPGRAPHRAEDLRRRIAALEQRAKAELTGGTQRAVVDQLERVSHDPSCAAAPEECWQELRELEADNFGR